MNNETTQFNAAPLVISDLTFERVLIVERNNRLTIELLPSNMNKNELLNFLDKNGKNFLLTDGEIDKYNLAISILEHIEDFLLN